ncbi:MAG: sugar phosphate isomerase/epimerase [bacterium]
MNDNIVVSQVLLRGYNNPFEYIGEAADKVELRVSDMIESDSPDNIDAIRDEARKYSVDIISVHAPFHKTDISCLNTYERKRSIRNIEKAVVIAGRLQARYTVLHISTPINDNDRDKRWNNAFDSLAEINETAQRYKIELLIENTLPGRLFYDREGFEKITDSGYSICLDTGHALISGLNLTDIYRSFKAHIPLMHIHTNSGSHDSHSFFDRAESPDVRKLLSIADKSVLRVLEIRDSSMSPIEIVNYMRTL